MKLCPIKTNLETTISERERERESINHTNLYTVGKKLSKWVYTPLKAGFLQMFQIFLFCETLLY